MLRQVLTLAKPAAAKTCLKTFAAPDLLRIGGPCSHSGGFRSAHARATARALSVTLCPPDPDLRGCRRTLRVIRLMSDDALCRTDPRYLSRNPAVPPRRIPSHNSFYPEETGRVHLGSDVQPLRSAQIQPRVARSHWEQTMRERRRQKGRADELPLPTGGHRDRVGRKMPRPRFFFDPAVANWPDFPMTPFDAAS